jgi:hypothetical protein
MILTPASSEYFKSNFPPKLISGLIVNLILNSLKGFSPPIDSFTVTSETISRKRD